MAKAARRMEKVEVNVDPSAIFWKPSSRKPAHFSRLRDLSAKKGSGGWEILPSA